MAITKTLVFEKFGTSASGSASGYTNYDIHLTESAEVTLTPVIDTVDDGQSLVSAYDVNFSVTVYNTDVLTDGNVYADAATTPSKGRISFWGTTGAANVIVDGVIINANRTFDGNRTGVQLTGTKRTTNVDLAVTVS
jgi:hypothetical protein